MFTKTYMSSSLSMHSRSLNIGTHNLILYSSRPFSPSPSPSTPALLLLPGLASSVLSWSPVIRALSPTTHVYTYDRSGQGSSDPSPLPPTSENLAHELDLLLRKAEIHQPLIVVGHSWAGIFGVEYALLRLRERSEKGGVKIAGMVLVDANQERTLEVADWRDPDVLAVTKGISDVPERYFEVIGVNREHKLEAGDFEAFMRAQLNPEHEGTNAREGESYAEGFPKLKAKGVLGREPPLLGDRPVAVVIGKIGRDFQRMYDEGVKRGNGTEEERGRMREMLRTWDERQEECQREQLGYSTNGKVFMAEESGHWVGLTQPEVIVEGVRWCLEEYEKQR